MSATKSNLEMLFGERNAEAIREQAWLNKHHAKLIIKHLQDAFNLQE